MKILLPQGAKSIDNVAANYRHGLRQKNRRGSGCTNRLLSTGPWHKRLYNPNQFFPICVNRVNLRIPCFPPAKPISFFLEIYEVNSDFPAMLLKHSVDREKNPAPAGLSELEIEAIEMFINFLRIIGLQKSVGEIYGLLFVSAKPLAMDDIMNRLDISLGAASQGLKLLRSVGAVKSVYSPRDRRDHFAADLELSKFATVFIKEELRPRVERALQRIQYMESLLADMQAEERQATRQRLLRLRHWLEKGEKMLPWVLKFLVK